MATHMYTIDTETSDWLDALRGLCAIIVFVGHANEMFNLPLTGLEGYPPLVFGMMVSYAVMAFFVISGFVITTSILRNIATNGTMSYRQFLVSRVARIYPPLIFALLLTLLVYGLIHGLNLHGAVSFRLSTDRYLFREHADMLAGEFFASLFMLHGFVKDWYAVSMNGALWTISYECWLYLIALLAAGWLKDRRLLSGALPLGAIVGYLYITGNTRFLFLGTVWTVGVVAALLYHRGVRLRLYVLIPLIGLLSGIIGSEIYRNWQIILPSQSDSGMLFQALVVVYITLLCCLPRVRASALTRPWKQTAAYSYTLYIVHYPLSMLAFSLLHQFYVNSSIYLRGLIFALVCAAILGISAALSRPLENTRFYAQLLNGLLTRLGGGYRLASADGPADHSVT